MGTNFNFKSSVCTSKEQSERLLALGLKKETADMAYLWYGRAEDDTPLLMDKPSEVYQGIMTTHDIPAWSLHRLIELKQPNTIDNAIVVLSREQTYDKLIGMIAKSIKRGNFPKEYLVNQAEIEEHCKGVLEYLDYIRGEEE